MFSKKRRIAKAKARYSEANRQYLALTAKPGHEVAARAAGDRAQKALIKLVKLEDIPRRNTPHRNQ